MSKRQLKTLRRVTENQILLQNAKTQLVEDGKLNARLLGLSPPEKVAFLRRLREKRREKALNDFFYFSKYVYGNQDLADMHQELCDFCTEPNEYATPEGGDFKLILEPRSSLKSSVVTQSYVLWRLLREPNLRVLIDSEEHARSKAFVAAIKARIEQNETFRELFGHLDQNKNKGAPWTWTESAFTIATRTHFTPEPSVMCAGLDSTRTGYHYDLIIMDDMVSDQNTKTDAQIKKTVDHYQLILSILDPGKEMIVIGTRWHFADLYGYLIAEDKEMIRHGEKPQWKKLIRPAVYQDGTLLWPERLSKEFLKDRRRRQGVYKFSCHPNGSPILMADGTLKCISKVKVGDTVLGFETDRNKLVPSKVLDTNSRDAETQWVGLEDGTFFRATPDHQFYRGRKEAGRPLYGPLVEGSLVKRVYEIHRRGSLRDWSYLAGIVDGEGACKHGSIYIHQSEDHNPDVCRKIQETIDRLGLDYGTFENGWYLRGGKQLKLDLIRKGRPAKAPQIMGTILRKNSRSMQSVKVESLEPYGEELVYALTTDTGNYIVNGLASKNCQYINDPSGGEDAIFKKEWLKFFTKTPEGTPLSFTVILDPSLGKNKKSDYSAVTIQARDHFNNRYMVRVMRGRWNPTKALEMFLHARQWVINTYDLVPRCGIETVAFQWVLKHNILEMMRKGRIPTFKIHELTRTTETTKHLAIERLVPLFEQGYIRLRGLSIEKCSPGAKFLIEEYLQFPVGKHDDILDTLAYHEELAKIPHIPRKDKQKPTLLQKLLKDAKRRGRIRGATGRVGSRIDAGEKPWQTRTSAGV